jgi:hypothetical protein
MSTVLNSINAKALRDPRLTPHPDRAIGGTKKISTFLNRRGDALAIDLSSGAKNGMFMAARLAPNSVLPAIGRVPYVEDKSRNSNINVRELKGIALTRFEPSSYGQAQDVLEFFANLGA